MTDDADNATANAQKQRRHERVAIPLLVQYRFGALDEPRFDYALNVSKSGLYINANVEHPANTRVFVQVTTRDGAHFLQGEGRVVRASDGGSAIELVGFSDADQAVLNDLVIKAMADAQAPHVGKRSRAAAIDDETPD
jgi:PilZ domain